MEARKKTRAGVQVGKGEAWALVKAERTERFRGQGCGGGGKKEDLQVPGSWVAGPRD